MCERHERLLAFFYGLYKAAPIPIHEIGLPTQEIITALSKEDWAKPPDKWLWYFWNDVRGQVHCESVEEDLENLHCRGYIYIDENGAVWPTGRAYLALGRENE